MGSNPTSPSLPTTLPVPPEKLFEKPPVGVPRSSHSNIFQESQIFHLMCHSENSNPELCHGGVFTEFVPSLVVFSIRLVLYIEYSAACTASKNQQVHFPVSKISNILYSTVQ